MNDGLGHGEIVLSNIMATLFALGIVGEAMTRLSTKLRFAICAVVITLCAVSGLAQTNTAAPPIQTADIGQGITLHYVEQGTGTPVIFVHGSLSDGGYWADEVTAFGKNYRAIAYSRRYNYPNDNPARNGYSAIVDADDLAALIRTIHLARLW